MKHRRRHDPLLLGKQSLEFDNADASARTDDQEAHRFMVHWTASVDPFARYEKWILLYGADEAAWHRLVRMEYIQFVIREGWDDVKFVMVLDELFMSRRPLHRGAIAKLGEQYDRGQLPAQVAASRKRQGRKRI